MLTICNDSHSDFILLGFSDKPYLEKTLFWVILIFYCLTITGNVVIILISLKDPKLHSPMYYFLSNLSLLDLCFTSSCVPQMLVNFWGPERPSATLAVPFNSMSSCGLGPLNVSFLSSWLWTAVWQCVIHCNIPLSCTQNFVCSWPS